MDAARRDPAGRLDHLHRVGAILFGLGLVGFGILGLVDRLEMLSTSGQSVLGLSSNGLLSVISLIVGATLVAAGARGGRAASTVLVVIGAAFVLSGLVNVLVLGTALNLLAFRMSNVIFSLIAGALLLILGAWGRFTASLPPDNPYWRERHEHDAPPEELPTFLEDPYNALAARELADAERAVAQHVASPDVAAHVAAVHALRRVEDRVREWRKLRA